jgi:hypothetical protein
VKITGALKINIGDFKSKILRLKFPDFATVPDSVPDAITLKSHIVDHMDSLEDQVILERHKRLEKLEKRIRIRDIEIVQHQLYVQQLQRDKLEHAMINQESVVQKDDPYYAICELPSFAECFGEFTASESPVSYNELIEAKNITGNYVNRFKSPVFPMQFSKLIDNNTALEVEVTKNRSYRGKKAFGFLVPKMKIVDFEYCENLYSLTGIIRY